MSQEDIVAIEGSFYFLSGFKHIYCQDQVDRMIKDGCTIKDGLCKVTGIMSMLLAFKSSLFTGRENYHYRAKHGILTPLPSGSMATYFQLDNWYRIRANVTMLDKART